MDITSWVFIKQHSFTYFLYSLDFYIEERKRLDNSYA
jgi:hypothetical protein